MHSDTHHQSDLTLTHGLVSRLDLYTQTFHRHLHKIFAMFVTCHQGMLIFMNTWSRPIWNLHMLYCSGQSFENLSFFIQML